MMFFVEDGVSFVVHKDWGDPLLLRQAARRAQSRAGDTIFPLCGLPDQINQGEQFRFPPPQQRKARENVTEVGVVGHGVLVSIFPVRKPLPKGLNGTKPGFKVSLRESVCRPLQGV